MLNEAYRVLAREDLRREYDASIGKMRVGFGGIFSGIGYSSWKGPLRPQALFVDENKCIGWDERLIICWVWINIPPTSLSFSGISSDFSIFLTGCRECVHHAGNTFVMDDALGCARVKVQYGDDDKKIEVSHLPIGH